MSNDNRSETLRLLEEIRRHLEVTAMADNEPRTSEFQIALGIVGGLLLAVAVLDAFFGRFALSIIAITCYLYIIMLASLQGKPLSPWKQLAKRKGQKV